MDFHPIKIEDKELLNKAIFLSPKRSCDASFASNFIWRDVYQIEVAYYKSFAVIKYMSAKKPIYAFPIGSGDLNEIISLLLEDYKNNCGTLEGFLMNPLVDENVEALEAAMPGKFSFLEERDQFDYIYTSEKLSTLAGKKLHGKRNHIARFMDNPDWSYEAITKENLEECKALNKEWLDSAAEGLDGEALDELMLEQSAVLYALDNLEALSLTGGAIRREGKIVAFSVGEPLTKDTYVIHIEKACADIQGAYPMINKEFVLHNCMDYKYINREDDAGDEGLRRAKLSYYPDILLEKYSAVLN